MGACAKFTMICKDEAVELVKKMEERGGKDIVPSTFKPLEPLVLKADFDKLIRAGKLEDKPNALWLRNKTMEIMRERYWTWILLHPGLRPDKIHEDRGVPAKPPSLPFHWDLNRGPG